MNIKFLLVAVKCCCFDTVGWVIERTKIHVSVVPTILSRNRLREEVDVENSCWNDEMWRWAVVVVVSKWMKVVAYTMKRNVDSSKKYALGFTEKNILTALAICCCSVVYSNEKFVSKYLVKFFFICRQWSEYARHPAVGNRYGWSLWRKYVVFLCFCYFCSAQFELTSSRTTACMVACQLLASDIARGGSVRWFPSVVSWWISNKWVEWFSSVWRQCLE